MVQFTSSTEPFAVLQMLPPVVANAAGEPRAGRSVGPVEAKTGAGAARPARPTGHTVGGELATVDHARAAHRVVDRAASAVAASAASAARVAVCAVSAAAAAGRVTSERAIRE